MNSPALLLLLTGALLGLTFPFGKLALELGVSPFVWAWLISAGSGICLLALTVLRRESIRLTSEHLRFYVISALISLAIPNVLIFSVVPRLGAGYTGLLFTLSPIFTLALSALWRLRLPSRTGLFGIAFGFAGALIVASTRGELGQPASWGWIVAGLAIPAILAGGNVYRTLAWPQAARAMELAAGSNLASGLLLLVAIWVLPTVGLPGGLNAIWPLAALSVLASTAMFTVFFRLQWVGGPTYLSQIGYVAAAVALLSGTVFLGERYAAITWFGAGVILLGIVLSIQAQRQLPEPPSGGTLDSS